MFRIVIAASTLVLGFAFFNAEAQVVKKKPADLSVLSGTITDVNLDDAKKVESLFVEKKVGKRVFRQNVRLNEKTKLEFDGFKSKKDEVLKVGQAVAVKIDVESDYATTIKVTPTLAAVAPPKKVK